MSAHEEIKAYHQKINDMEKAQAQVAYDEIIEDAALVDRYRRLQKIMIPNDFTLEEFIKNLYRNPEEVTEEWVSLLEKVNNK